MGDKALCYLPSPSLTQLQLHWPPCLLLPDSFCTDCSHCLECPSPRYLHGSPLTSLEPFSNATFSMGLLGPATMPTPTLLIQTPLLVYLFFKPTSVFLCKDFIYLFLERGEGREKERKRNIHVWLPFAHPLLGTWPALQACAPTGNPTRDPLVHRLALNPLNHTRQDSLFLLFTSWHFSPGTTLFNLLNYYVPCLLSVVTYQH